MEPWKSSKTLPDVVEATWDGGYARLQLHLSPDLFHFQGHFPGNPVLPGVAQVDIAVQFAGRYLNISDPVREVTKLKFRQLMRPETDIQLELEHVAEKACIRFVYLGNGDPCSSGTLHLAVA